MPPSEQAVRLAAFRFVEEQVRLVADEGALRRTVLERGFDYEGQRVPLLGPQGIFKPRVVPDIPNVVAASHIQRVECGFEPGAARAV